MTGALARPKIVELGICQTTCLCSSDLKQVDLHTHTDATDTYLVVLAVLPLLFDAKSVALKIMV